MKYRILVALILLTIFRQAQAQEEQLPYPAMSESIIEMLTRFYYDHDRFQPQLMLTRALRAIETSEMSVDTHLDGDQVRFNFAGEHVTVDIERPSTLEQLKKIFKDMQTLILDRAEYSADERSEMVYAMYNGALQTLDPHTLIFPPKPASDFTDDLQGEFFGIGAYLSQEDGVVKIDRVMPGRPAEKAGVRNGDKIIQVDGEKTAGLSLSESVSRIKGPRGTKVVLTIERPGVEEPLKIEVIRDLVRVEVIQAYRQGDIAYLRLDEFNKNADGMMRRALYKWDRDVENPVMGLVLDLRFNGGGRLDKAKIISDMFLPSKKEIVRTVSKGRKPYIQYSSKDNISILDVPMLVLVSPSSASAAEILAGALQQNNRAAIVGRTSYGKGSVQQYRPLKNSSIFKFTVQEYQLRDGISIQGVGIVPDIELLRHGVQEDGSVDLLPFTRSSESDAEFALKSIDNYKHKSTYHLSWLAEYEDIESIRKHYISAGEKFTPDQEAQLVIDLLADALTDPESEDKLDNADISNFGETVLDMVKNAIQKRQQRESADLAKSLSEHGAVKSWGVVSDADVSQLELTYTGPKQLQVGVKEELTFKVENKSDSDIGCLYAVIRRDREDSSSPFWEEEILLGNAAAAGAAQGSMAFTVPPRLYAGQERFAVDLYQQGRKDAITSTQVEVEIVSDKRPHFNFSWHLDSDDGRIQYDRQEELVLTVRNDGNADSAPITLLMSKKDNRFVQLGEGRWKLDALAAGAQQEVRVPFSVASVLALRTKKLTNEDDNVALELFIEERFEESGISQFREGLTYEFNLPIDVEIKGADLQKPKIALESMHKEKGKLQLSVKVDDDNLAFVTVFQGKDKIALHTAEEVKDGLVNLNVDLMKGLNHIQVLVRDEDQLVKYLPIRCWSDEGKVAAVPTAALSEDDDEEEFP